MTCAKPTPLSTEGSFEKVVNTGTSYRRSLTQKWFGKTLWTVVVLLAVELINLILWVADVIPSMPSICISEILTCVVGFFAGRLYEVMNK